MAEETPDYRIGLAAARVMFDEFVEDMWSDFVEECVDNPIGFKATLLDNHYIELHKELLELGALLPVDEHEPRERKLRLIAIANRCWTIGHIEGTLEVVASTAARAMAGQHEADDAMEEMSK